MADWERIGAAIAKLLLAGGDVEDIAVLLAAHPDELSIDAGPDE